MTIRRHKESGREMAMVEYRLDKYFKNMVRARMIPNSPVTLDDIKNSNKIFGPDVPSLKGEMVRQKSKPMVSNYVKIPKEVLQLHKTVLVAAYIMFVNGMEFLIIIYRHVKSW